MQIQVNKEMNHFLSFQEIREVFARHSSMPGFSIQEIGASEAGIPIELISYKGSNLKKDHANEANSILLFGGEDASEPIFSQTISWLLAEISQNDSPIHQFNASWHFISCINPDGYKKNAGWLKHPGDLKHFLESSWEDLHHRMIFWKTEARNEHQALRKAIEITLPNHIYNLHDESHFPAEGYKFAFSSPVNLPLLNPHLDRIKEFMDISSDELVITDSYGRDPNFSVFPALELNKDIFIFLNESCGYKRTNAPMPKISINVNNPLYEALGTFKELQLANFNPELESSLFHTNLLIKSVEANEEFNTKMLAITGYAIESLIQSGIMEAKEIKEIFLSHIEEHFKKAYAPIPVWQQVFTQLDFLFSVLEIRGV